MTNTGSASSSNTSVNSTLPMPSTFTTRTRPELAAAASQIVDISFSARDGNKEKEEVVYKILYLKLHGMAATTRAILAIAGVSWESIYPTDWKNVEKERVPMGVMPVLYEVHKATGLTLEIPESEAIERYLSRKFSLLGQDPWEETAINVFYSSSNSLMSLYIQKVLLAFPETKSRELEKFIQKDLPLWIEQHEKWLDLNGLNGHYVGDHLSLADIRSVICLDRYMSLPECQGFFSEEKTRGLFTLKKTLEKNGKYSAWLASEEFEAINVSTRQRLAVLSG